LALRAGDGLVGERGKTPLDHFPIQGYLEGMTLLTVDSKKRVALGKLLKDSDIEHFQGEMLPSGEILLHPMAMIPARERWLHENPKAMASVKRGLEQSRLGQVKTRGAFAKYAKD
jgi:hypothetical protein